MKTFENMYGKKPLNMAEYKTSSNIGFEGFTFGNEVEIVEMKLPVYKGYRPSVKKDYFIYGFITDTGEVYVGMTDDINYATVYNIKSAYETYKKRGDIKNYVLPLSLDEEKVQKYIKAYKMIEPFTTTYTIKKYPVNIEELEKKELYENIYYIEYYFPSQKKDYKGYIVETPDKLRIGRPMVYSTLDEVLEKKQKAITMGKSLVNHNDIIEWFKKSEGICILYYLTDVQKEKAFFAIKYRPPVGKERIYLVEKHTIHPPSASKRYEFVVIHPDGKKKIFDSFTLDIAIAGRGNYKYKDGYRIGYLEDIKHHHRDDFVIIKDADGKEVLFESMPGETKTGTCYKEEKLKDGDIRVLFDRNKYKELESKYYKLICKDDTGTYFRKPSTGTEGIFWVDFVIAGFINGEPIDIRHREGYTFAYLDPETGERDFELSSTLDRIINLRNREWGKGMSIGTSKELIAVINSAKNREVIEVKCAAKIKTIYINEKPELLEWRIPEGYEGTTSWITADSWKEKGCKVIRTEKHYGKTWYLFDKACVEKKIEIPFCETKLEKRSYLFYKHEETAAIEERRKKDAGYYIACKDKSGVYMREYQKGSIVKGEYYKVKVSSGIIGREYKETFSFFIAGVRNKVEPYETYIKVGETWQDIVGWLPNWTKKKFYRTLPYSEIIDAAIDPMKDKIIEKVGAKKEAKPTIFVNIETKKTYIYEYNPWIVPPAMIYETEPVDYKLPVDEDDKLPPLKDMCFIATAAYGTPFAKEIDILRAFRDNSLEPKLIGKKLVNTYYKISPPIANFISRREKLRAITRFMLKPIVRAFKK